MLSFRFAEYCLSLELLYGYCYYYYYYYYHCHTTPKTTTTSVAILQPTTNYNNNTQQQRDCNIFKSDPSLQNNASAIPDVGLDLLEKI